jgi:hypothetical protein
MRNGTRRRAVIARVAVAAALLGTGMRADAARPPTVANYDVRLADHPAVDHDTPADPIAVRLRGALNRSNRYALTVWWDRYMAGVAPYQAAEQRARTTYTIDSEEVRRYTSVAYSLAASLASGAYDQAVTGVDPVTATERVVELVHYVAVTHRANVATSYGWGGSVQASLWAAQAATAGWLIGAALPPPVQLMVGRMLAYEADTVLARKVHYLRDAHGRVLTPGDSGAEELAWDGVALYTAVELLPHHGHRALWAEAAYTRFVGAFARPVDVRSAVRVNGRATSSWLGGSNAEPDGFVVNHHRLNPDYTTDIALWAAPVAGLVGVDVPAAVIQGADLTYRALTTKRFSSPPYLRPGGTVYRPGSSTVYYPQGADWGAHREAVYGSLDVQTAALSPNARVRAVATRWAVVHLDVVRTMQARFTTGQIYGPQSEDHYRAREEHAAMLLGTAYLTWWQHSNDGIEMDQDDPTVGKVTLP